MRRELQPYEQRRRLPTLLLGLVLSLPLVIAIEIGASGWRQTAPRAVVVAALMGVIVLYALMFLVLFYRFPRWIKAHMSEDEARRWQYAALNAGVATGPIMIAWTVTYLPIQPPDLGLGLGMLVSIFVFAMLLWLMARHFPEACNWIPFRRRGLKNGPRGQREG